MTLFVSPLSSDLSCELCPAVTALSLTCSALVQYNDYNAMQRSTNNVVNYSELHYSAMQCNAMQQYSTMQCITVNCITLHQQQCPKNHLQCNAIHHYIALHYMYQRMHLAQSNDVTAASLTCSAMQNMYQQCTMTEYQQCKPMQNKTEKQIQCSVSHMQCNAIQNITLH